MNRDALIRALRAYAKANGLPFRWDASHGKGGHGRVYVGETFTTLPSGEIKTGLKAAILKQLKLPKDAV
ncbi:MAG: hypothetical protein P4L73_19150 [Caulobacteraceae bacterium]|nr:hypothetical protein [Caulobacteraceae bacterium]